jgi:uncharacterized membrane protein
MVNIKRWLKHCFMPPWYWRLKFSNATLSSIEQAITQSEHLHKGELRFAIENALAPIWVWRGMSVYQRATEIFSSLRIWDTEENSGVLIYLLLADREVHILADRGIAGKVAQAEWQSIAEVMQGEFKQDHYQAGALQGISLITDLLAKHFPPGANKLNELPNRPVIIRQ